MPTRIWSIRSMAASSRLRLELVLSAIPSVVVALAIATPVYADQPVGRGPAKIAGLPVGIVKQAFASNDETTRKRLLALLAQRVVRNAGARARFLAVDAQALAVVLASYEHATEMLSAVMNRTTDSEIRDKLAQVIASISALRAVNP